MVSITDCVVEGLKYPFNDLKRLVGFGCLFAVISAISVIISFKSLDIFRVITHALEQTNSTALGLQFAQLPAGDIYLVAALGIVSFIVSLFILGYQYDVVKFSIEKRDDLPGFSDIIGMFVKGIKYFLVFLAYNIIPLVIFACGMFVSTEVFLALAVVSGLLFIIAFFLVIMGLNNMIAHDSLAKAFDFRQIIDNISNLGWGKYIGIVIFALIAYMIIMVAVSVILSFLTVIFAVAINNQAFIVGIVISIIEGLFIDSYGAVFFNRVCGSIYRESIK